MDVSPEAMDVTVRSGALPDVPAINAIYNHYVRTSAVTFDLEEVSLEARQAWVQGFAPGGRHRLLVAERGGRVAGYACTRKFRDKAAYDTTVETSVYCDPKALGLGIGRRLYQALFADLAGEDVHRIYAGITLPNPASLALHHAFGFVPLARFGEVGRKFGRYWDVQWMERPGPAA